MSDRTEPTNELTATAEGPELYVRINITKQAKGYVHETTVSLRWEDNGALDWQWELEALLLASDTTARAEIVRREALDVAEKGEATS